MADYKELLRRAVEALPENNGAARRAVYEKARAALVGQLRAINPPLAARDITAHRLQLEDCIRQVEQEASEAVIAGLGSSKEEAPPPPPVYFEPPAKKAPASVARPVAKPVRLSRAVLQIKPRDDREKALLLDRASTAAYVAYQRARDRNVEADSLSVLGRSLAAAA